MQYILSKQFEKNFLKLPKKVKDRALKQFELFIIDPMGTQLNNHSLSGKWSEYRSINITGDVRVIYTIIDKDVAMFIDVGSHSKLYS